MDQNQAPSFEIPKSHEAAPLASTSADVDPNLSIEGTREILPAPMQPVVGQVPVPTLASTQLQPPTASPAPTVSAAPLATHLIADDVDVIEKEWVERAKKIVSLTSNDPYLEARELNKLKNTYMKKRFNKDLPEMTEGQ